MSGGLYRLLMTVDGYVMCGDGARQSAHKGPDTMMQILPYQRFVFGYLNKVKEFQEFCQLR